LEDVTLRALRVLREVDLVACEDTRRTGQLFDLLGVPSRPLVAVHDHNERARAERIVAVLAEGQDVALVSDAGTPTINDPGYALVRAVVDAGFEVVSVPGPCAVITALAGAGLPTDRFRFLGFPPAKVEARRQAFEEVVQKILDSPALIQDVTGGPSQLGGLRGLAPPDEDASSGSCGGYC
jgi:16S rRNA (cytidine1402-2'-O)-methyltransferase